MKAFPYYGSKKNMLKYILPYLNIKHKIYVEVFGGSAVVLLNKKPSDFEVYNDIYFEVVNFFRVIRNCFDRKKLQEFIKNVPYSREEFSEFKRTLSSTEDKIERAAKFYFLHSSSYSGHGHSFTVTIRRKPNLVYQDSEKLNKITSRLRSVAIENLDWEEVLTRFDSEETLFYLDPPYVNTTLRGAVQYNCKIGDDIHQKMVDKILTLKGKFILSGYDNRIYDKLISEKSYLKKTYQIDLPSQKFINGKLPEKAEECLWLSDHFQIFEKRKIFFFQTDL